MCAYSERCGSDTKTVMRTVTAACLLACVARAETAGRVVYPLEQTTLDTPSYSYLRAPVSRTKPANAGAMPAFENGRAAFMDLRLGDGKPLLLAVEPLTREGNAGFRVYWDANGNRSLADETPCETSADPMMRRGPLQYTPPITVPVVYRLPSGEVRRNCQFRLGFYPIPPNANNTDDRLFYFAQLIALQGWSGQIPFGNKTVRLTFLDGDGDAKLQVLNTASQDRMQIESASPTRSRVDQILTRCLDVDGVLYRLEVQPDGSQLAVSRYKDALGTVAWEVKNGSGQPAELSMFSFVGANLAVSSQAAASESRDVPVGDYNLTYMIGKENPRALFRMSSPVRIGAGAASRIACGGPVIVSGTVSQREESGETALYVRISATNAAGHDFQVSGSRQAGRVEVLGPDGVSAGAGNMEYG